MTRKDYIRFAAMLKDMRIANVNPDYPWKHADKPTLDAVVLDTARIFAADNSRFDRVKFLKACGVES